MTIDERYETLDRMSVYGGSFVQALAAAARRADGANFQRLLDAFPDYFEKYGPNGDFARKGATE